MEVAPDEFDGVQDDKQRLTIQFNLGVTLILTLDSVSPFEGNDVPRQRH